MTAKKYLAANRVLAELTKTQLQGRGALPVVVEFMTPEGTVLSANVLTAKFNANSGNIVLTAKG